MIVTEAWTLSGFAGKISLVGAALQIILQGFLLGAAAAGGGPWHMADLAKIGGDISMAVAVMVWVLIAGRQGQEARIWQAAAR